MAYILSLMNYTIAYTSKNNLEKTSCQSTSCNTSSLENVGDSAQNVLLIGAKEGFLLASETVLRFFNSKCS